MNYYNLSAKEKQKISVKYARHELEAWRRLYANTHDPTQKLFAQNQINHYLKAINQ